MSRENDVDNVAVWTTTAYYNAQGTINLWSPLRSSKNAIVNEHASLLTLPLYFPNSLLSMYETSMFGISVSGSSDTKHGWYMC